MMTSPRCGGRWKRYVCGAAGRAEGRALSSRGAGRGAGRGRQPAAGDSLGAPASLPRVDHRRRRTGTWRGTGCSAAPRCRTGPGVAGARLGGAGWGGGVGGERGRAPQGRRRAQPRWFGCHPCPAAPPGCSAPPASLRLRARRDGMRELPRGRVCRGKRRAGGRRGARHCCPHHPPRRRPRPRCWLGSVQPAAEASAPPGLREANASGIARFMHIESIIWADAAPKYKLITRTSPSQQAVPALQNKTALRPWRYAPPRAAGA